MHGAGVALKTRGASFNEIVQRSTISLFRKGSYGIILKCILPDGESPYIDSWSGQPITTLLIKCMAVASTTSDYNIKINGKTEELTNVDQNDFESEVYIQEELYSRTALNPICPAILKADLYTLDAFERLLPGVLVDRRRLYRLPSMGVIAMEMVSEPQSFAELCIQDPNQFITHVAKARAKLLELGSLGYVHGDHHPGNVVFSRNEERVYLIDFGQTRPFYADDFSRFKRAMYRKNYTYALRLMMFARKENDPDGFFTSYITPDMKKDALVKYLIKVHWATSQKVQTILRTIAPRPLLQYYAPLYGWVFHETYQPGRTPFQGPQLLTLTQTQKKELAEALEKDVRIGPVTGWPLGRRTRRSPRTSPSTPSIPTVSHSTRSIPPVSPSTRSIQSPQWAHLPVYQHSPLAEGVALYS